ncbi:hypothetical protein H180DRAFT_02197 [Streptomyces sp. WMMB 322]|nr:hypothetical protein H180DRAFT_02197 [Streptomyces sp. WMMB 322]
MLAAGLGLAALTVLVLLLWIVSPYPESGAGAALHLAADLWLLGHGSALVRTETLSGIPAPVALTPLLLVIPPVCLLHRACTQALAAGGDESAGDARTGADAEDVPGPLAPLGCVAGGYLVTGAVTVLFASAGPVRADVLSASVRLPLFVLCVAAAAMWPGWGRTPPAAPNELDRAAGSPSGGRTQWPAVPTAREPDFPAPVLAEARALSRRLRPARTALTAMAVLCGGGLVVTLGALLWHVDEVQSAFPRLAGDSWTGQFAVLLLVIALLPNAAVWAAAYGLGPGFALGTGAVVGPFTQTGAASLLPFPLLEALPAAGGGPGLLGGIAAVAVPLAAGATVGWYVARAAAPVTGRCEAAVSRRATLAVVALVGCECAVGVAVLAAFSGGALGTEAMAVLGPSWPLTGVAAFLWAVLVGAPVALAMRAWRLRGSGGDDGPDAAAARQARWSELKAVSGGLMPDFEPRRD